MRIVTEIGNFDDGDFITSVDTERLIKFIEEHGVDYEEHCKYSVTIRLEDFTYVMTYDQLKLFFSHKPALIHFNSETGFYPITPGTFSDDGDLEFINVILESYDNDWQLKEWRKLLLKHMIGVYSISNRKDFLGKVIVTFDNYDKKSKSFFELMKCRLIDQINNNFNKK